MKTKKENWNYKQPINYLPEKIKNLFVEQANYLLHELENNKLKVVLVPAPDPHHIGHMIRSVEERNPGWYRELYHSYSHFKRNRSIEAIKRIATLKDKEFKIRPYAPYKYDMVYRTLILERLTEGYSECILGLEDKESKIHSNKKARMFFRKEISKKRKSLEQIEY